MCLNPRTCFKANKRVTTIRWNLSLYSKPFQLALYDNLKIKKKLKFSFIMQIQNTQTCLIYLPCVMQMLFQFLSQHFRGFLQDVIHCKHKLDSSYHTESCNILGNKDMGVGWGL